MKNFFKVLGLLLLLVIGGFILYIGAIVIALSMDHTPITYMFTGALWLVIPVMIIVLLFCWFVLKALFRGPIEKE